MENIKHVVFSGGSTKVFFFVGALKYIENVYPSGFQNVETFVGSSVGSIFSLLCCLGLSHKEIINVFDTIAKKYSETTLEIDEILNVYTSLGIDDGSICLSCLQSVIEDQFDCKDITFKQLYEWIGKKLVITAFNVHQKRTDFFSYETFPDVNVLTAIRASFSIPIIFKPQKILDCLYIDGSILDHFPVSYLYDKVQDPTQVLGFVINITKDELSDESLSLPSFAHNIINFLFFKVNELENRTHVFPKTISFCADNTHEDFCLDFQTMRLKAPSTETKNKWIHCGYKLTEKEFLKYK